MEHLIIDLKEKLLLRREHELQSIRQYDAEKFKDIMLISSGKIFELDRFIVILDEMLNYYNHTKRITK